MTASPAASVARGPRLARAPVGWAHEPCDRSRGASSRRPDRRRRRGEPMTDPAPQTDARLPAPDGSTDPHQWLEEVTGEEALAWVQERNAAAESELDAVPDPQDPAGAPLTRTLQAEILENLEAKDRIPAVAQRGALLN